MEPSVHPLMPVVMNLARYLFMAGIPFLVLYVLFSEKFSRQKIQQRLARNKDFLREVLYSFQTILVVVLVAGVVIYSPMGGLSKIYYEIDAYPMWWFPVSILLALIIHDTYFYWTHRLMHHRRIFKWVHLVHHKSVNPTPLASYAFNLSEAFLEALIGPVIILLIPMNIWALLIYVTISFAFNVYGHLGYEFMPRWFRHSFLFEIMNTSVHHNMHHKHFRGNYGLYFRWWDRLMKTEHPAYVATYDNIQIKRFGPSSVSHSTTAPVHKALFALVILLSLALFSFREPATIIGKWRDPKTSGVISIYKKGGKFYGRLIAADDPKHHAKIQQQRIMIMQDFEEQADGTYCCGTLYQPLFNRYLDGTLTLKNDSVLVVEGHYGLLSGTREMYRQ